MSKVAVFIQQGDVIDYLNSSEADLAAGDVVVIGEIVGVCETDIVAAATGPVKIVGVWKLPAIATAAFSAGDKLYWDATEEVLTNTQAPAAGFPAHAEGNTGDADISEVVVTPGSLAVAETWFLECISAAVKAIAAGTPAHALANTGDADLSGATVTPGANAVAETWTLECIQALVNALAAGAPAADEGNTGKAVVSGATVTLGASAIAETWTLTCADITTPGSEIWNVIGSKTGRIADLTTAVAFVSPFINVTIPAGDGSGTAHWAAGDIVTIAVTATGATSAEAIFQVYGSKSGRMDDLVADAAYDNGFIALTLPSATGAETAFAVGDVVTIALTATGATATEAIFQVYGSVTGMMDQLVAGAAYDNGYIALTLPAAAGEETAWAVGDVATIAVTVANIIAGICVAGKLSAGAVAYVKLNI